MIQYWYKRRHMYMLNVDHLHFNLGFRCRSKMCWSSLRWTDFRPTSQFHSSQSPLLQKIHLHRIFQTTNFFQRRDSPSAVGTDLVELATLKTLSLQIQQASQNSYISLDCPLLRSATWLDCFSFPLTHSHLVSLQHAADVLLLSDPCKFLFALLNLQQEDD